MLFAALTLAMTSTALPTPEALIRQVDPARLRAAVEKLASFPTRNTLSESLNDAARWLAAEYDAVPNVHVELFRYTLPRSRRVPEDKSVVQVVAWINGEGHSASTLAELKDRRAVLVGGHMDSLNLQVEAATGRAPGANDDASGTSLALELARILAPHRWKQTLVFVGFTGEEQGLHGARALAKFAKANGWQIDAMLNNDTVGSSSNKAGQKDEKQIRIFSDEAETHNSRELARFCHWAAKRHLKGFGAKLVMRADRFGRGGDHTPFAQEGFPAVRYIEVHEEYTRQHTPDDLPEFMDWKYLANASRANLAAMANLANAGPAPSEVRIVRNQSHDTSLTWKASPGTSYVVYWRDTASSVWQGWKEVGAVDKATIAKVNKDDHFFAVGAVGGVPQAAQ